MRLYNVYFYYTNVDLNCPHFPAEDYPCIKMLNLSPTFLLIQISCDCWKKVCFYFINRNEDLRIEMSLSNAELTRTLLPEEAQYLETRCQMPKDIKLKPTSSGHRVLKCSSYSNPSIICLMISDFLVQVVTAVYDRNLSKSLAGKCLKLTEVSWGWTQ